MVQPFDVPRFARRLLFPLVMAAWVLPASLAAQKTESAPATSCATCINAMTCAGTSQPGAWAAACSIEANGQCRETLSLCFIDEPRAAADLRLRPSEFLTVRTPRGVLPLAPVGESRFAAWSCDGQLLYLARRAPDGSLIPLSPERYRERYAYRRLTAAARRAA